MNSLDQSIPNTPGTADFIECTANGYNLFHGIWEGAVKGENGYTAFFAPWFETPEYREAAPADFERTFEEEELRRVRARQRSTVVASAQDCQPRARPVQAGIPRDAG
jgi:hypothetical protein